ncbi:LacI family DNA-binding transcriptional regulator [Nakamurella sp. YIM 132087]|uniref:LacI family DNA-binding transcriptional regulator n=1 Tax=Nakamurella alba TaxID=2665158 RepID=A0A7K1FJN4_9ACTN|nr:LacI family DNA-binding transcriptional regulator [Nakamurella alba]MTD14345.1 LacI family DNA-binding transcriptional regulator [Nakamurella alba]
MADHVTLADVAKVAGVSLATASRALNGAANRTVRADLRDRVLRAATELRYSPNANAQAMARGATSTVGLVVHDIADPFAAAIASGVMAAAGERGLIVTIASTLWDPAAEIRHVEALRRARARTVILAGSRFTDEESERRLLMEISQITAAGGHVATVGQQLPGVPAVLLDNLGGARRLARVLWTLGYRSFAVLSGPESLQTSEERLSGFRTGLADCGHDLPAENIIGTQLTRDGGYVAMTELLDREIEVEAVFAVNDVMAVGAMAALREQGWEVPRDMALAGFDDITTLRDIQPPLTTVRVPLAHLGRRALELALGPADGPEPPRGDEFDGPALPAVPGEVVVRASTPLRT